MPGSGNVLVDAIAGIGWLSRGGDRNITYFFDNSFGFHSWTSGEMSAFTAALQQYANVANITIQQVGTSASADISESWVSDAFMRANFGDAAANHQVPTTSRPAVGNYDFDGEPYWTASALALGGFGFQVFMHEIGHSLGLAHPHDNGMGTLLLPGVTKSDDLGTLSYNQNINSIMSYNTGPFTTSGSLNFGHAATPMAFDIAAVQFLYGANTSFHNGASTYFLPGPDATSAYWQCIWDAGGTDEIRYDGASNATIDLHAATLVNGDPNAGGFVSQVAGVFGGYTIANGVTIENAFGGSGNDTLTGNGASNILSGGGGDDTAVYWGNLSSYAPRDLGAVILVSGSDGNDQLFSIEHLRFADGTINVNRGNGLFDAVFYDRAYGDVFHAGVDAFSHFNNSGWHEGRNPDAYFSTRFYLAANSDVRASGVNPIDQYHQFGWREGRDPSPDFDTKLYLIHNPDVAAAGIDPLVHFLANGIAEGRQAYAAIGTAVNGFDAEYYLLHNPDVAAAGVDPLAHFNANGWHEGRNPNAYFDTAGYLAHYGDVAAAGINPLQHYEQYGWLEGRDPSAGFDTLGYLAQNPDVAAAHINPLDHFINNGIYEGRSVINDGLWH
jgi:serralysin